MNKTELIAIVAEKANISKTDAHNAVNAVFETAQEELKKGNKVSLVGFGTFGIIERKARTGINPKTKATINIPAKKSVKFKAGKDLI